jgi:opacity protein-like surface antigen
MVAGFFLCSSAAFAQVFEVGVSGGRALFKGNNANLGTVSPDPASPQYQMQDGFRLTFRITFNQGRFLGHEIGYAYNHTSLLIPATSTPVLNGVVTTPAQTVGVPIHQGFYDFLAYATPEGTKVRPFGAAGVNFSSFFPPGTSIYSGNQTTKYGFNFGGGLKVRITSIWGIRLDLRVYNTSKPFNFFNQNGRLNKLEASGGVTFNL